MALTQCVLEPITAKMSSGLLAVMLDACRIEAYPLTKQALPSDSVKSGCVTPPHIRPSLVLFVIVKGTSRSTIISSWA